jgi:hypothetical protein
MNLLRGDGLGRSPVHYVIAWFLSRETQHIGFVWITSGHKLINRPLISSANDRNLPNRHGARVALIFPTLESSSINLSPPRHLGLSKTKLLATFRNQGLTFFL